MGRAEEHSRTPVDRGWKESPTDSRPRAADAPLPSSVRAWIRKSHEPVAREKLGRMARQRRSRSTPSRGGLEQRLVALKTENASLKEQLERATTAPVLELLKAGRVTEARQLVSLLLKASPSPQLEQWARVIAPPIVRSGGPAAGSGIEGTYAWLRQHAGEYAGKWVALREGVLLGADVSRVALHRRLEQSGELEGALFARL